MRQTMSNLCQLLTPVMMLSLTGLLQLAFDDPALRDDTPLFRYDFDKFDPTEVFVDPYTLEMLLGGKDRDKGSVMAHLAGSSNPVVTDGQPPPNSYNRILYTGETANVGESSWDVNQNVSGVLGRVPHISYVFPGNLTEIRSPHFLEMPDQEEADEFINARMKSAANAPRENFYSMNYDKAQTAPAETAFRSPRYCSALQALVPSGSFLDTRPMELGGPRAYPYPLLFFAFAVDPEHPGNWSNIAYVPCEPYITVDNGTHNVTQLDPTCNMAMGNLTAVHQFDVPVLPLRDYVKLINPPLTPTELADFSLVNCLGTCDLYGGVCPFQTELESEVGDRKNFDVRYSVPTGTIDFSKFDLSTGELDVIIQTLADNQEWQWTYSPDSGLDAVEKPKRLWHWITNAFAREYIGSDEKLWYGETAMPEKELEEPPMSIASLAGALLYPFAISFLLPVYTFTLSSEKQARLREMMKMAGLYTSTYWASYYIFFLILYILVAAVFWGGGLLWGITFFSDVDWRVIALFLFIWGNVQISLGIFLSVFFRSGRVATAVSYMLVVVGVITGLVVDGIVYSDRDTDWFYILWPPFAMIRSFEILTASMQPLSSPMQLEDIPLNESLRLYIFMACEWFGYLVLGLYLDQVIPQEFGVQQHPLFPFYWLKEKYTGMKNDQQKALEKSPSGGTLPKSKEPQPLTRADRSRSFFAGASFVREAGLAANEDEDDDVNSTRLRVNQGLIESDDLINVINMTKEYRVGRHPLVAVNNVCMTIKEHECFGLLGPNAAGKTSFISVMTGLYPVTRGTAYVGGWDIRTRMNTIHLNMGICPQHDIIWEQLTVEEHLLFYARLKGVGWLKENAVVKEAIKEVGLDDASKRHGGRLSGGMKRRLSVAISLIGQPGVVYLDEPTTGLDPANRRQLWTIVNKAKRWSTIVLTTHSMEEADVLCNRLAIMAQGRLMCIGSQLYLKNKFGEGYKLSLNIKDSAKISAVHEWLIEHFPQASLVNEFEGQRAYQLPQEGLRLSVLFEVMEENKNKLSITDWGISQTSLEEVFMTIVKRSEAGTGDI